MKSFEGWSMDKFRELSQEELFDVDGGVVPQIVGEIAKAVVGTIIVMGIAYAYFRIVTRRYDNDHYRSPSQHHSTL